MDDAMVWPHTAQSDGGGSGDGGGVLKVWGLRVRVEAVLLEVGVMGAAVLVVLVVGGDCVSGVMLVVFVCQAACLLLPLLPSL